MCQPQVSAVQLLSFFGPRKERTRLTYSIVQLSILEVEYSPPTSETFANQSKTMIGATKSDAHLVKLSRWLRVALLLLFEPAVSDTGSGIGESAECATKADAILAQALALAKKFPPKQDEENDGTYPAEEVEWLATTTFNRAIDAYCALDDEKCQQLSSIAVDFAECLAGFDGGTLREALIVRRSSLVFTQEDEMGESG